MPPWPRRWSRPRRPRPGRCRRRRTAAPRPARAAAVVRRGLADGVEDRGPAADLLRPALPGRRHRRLHLAGLAAVPADLPPRRGPAGLPGGAGAGLRVCRAWSSGPRSATRLAARGLHLVFGMLAVAAVVASAFAVLFALAPSVPVAFFADAGIEASLAIVGPGGAGRSVPGHPFAGPLGRLLHRRALRPARAGGHPVGRRHRRRHRVPLRDADPGARLPDRRAGRGQRRLAHRRRRPERVGLHAHPGARCWRPGPAASCRCWRCAASTSGYDGVPVLRAVDLEIAEG